MPRSRSRPQSRARPRGADRSARFLSRYPLTVEQAASLARCLADDEPAFVVLLLDDEGLLVAVKSLDVAPVDVEAECATVLELLAPEGRGPAVLVSVDPGFGTDPTPVLGAWREARRRFEEAGGHLLDWLLVAGTQVRSVARSAEGGA